MVYAVCDFSHVVVHRLAVHQFCHYWWCGDWRQYAGLTEMIPHMLKHGMGFVNVGKSWKVVTVQHLSTAI